MIVTRSHKLNDKDHPGLANGTAAPEEHLPRYFAKHGHVGEDPKKVKKSGGGKGNWYVCLLTPSSPSPQWLLRTSRQASGTMALSTGQMLPYLQCGLRAAGMPEDL